MSEYGEEESKRGRPTNDERNADVHARALLRFHRSHGSQYQQRLLCAEDRRFYSIEGAQWEGWLGDQFENKPKFEVNKILLAVMRIFNEYRNNRIDVIFSAKDGSDTDLSDTCAGLYRADEQDSCAEEAYDNSFDESVGGGFGAYELCCEYEDEYDDDNHKQRIRILPIFDADKLVWFDDNAKRQDKSDAKWCVKLTPYTRDAYIEEWNDDPVSWPADIQTPTIGRSFDWCTPEDVYVAEYYEVEQKTVRYHWFRGLSGDEVKHSDAELKGEEGDMSMTLADRLKVTGYREMRAKNVKERRIHKYILSGGGILKDCGLIPGCHIPIVPQYGKRWFIDGIERYMGHVRPAKDPQRLKNMTVSKIAQISAMASYDKPIVTPEQMQGHAGAWGRENIDDTPYLLLNAILDANGNPMPAGPIGVKQAPQIPPALAALAQVSEQDINDVLGNQQAGEELQPNISGKAVELIQNKIDMQAFIYMSNCAKARKRGGEIWLSMAKEVYVEEGRDMKTIGLQGETERVELQRPIMGDEGLEYENDLSAADFDVSVDVGPSSQSKRAAIVRGLTGMMSITQDQETLMVLGSMALQNMEGEGLQEVRNWARKRLLRMGIGKPTDEEKEELAALANKPDPNAEFLQASAMEAAAKAKQAEANTVLTVAKVEETEAKTQEILAGIPREDQRAAVETAEKIGKALQPATN